MFSIPNPYVIIGGAAAAIAMVVVIYTTGFNAGKKNGELQISNFANAAQAQMQEIQKGQVKVEEKILIKYNDRIVYRNIQNARTQEVIADYVPDRNTELSNGWVFTHDASATGRDAEPARAADDSPSGVTANQALFRVNENYNTCKATRDQLTALQDWIKQTQANIEAENKKAD